MKGVRGVPHVVRVHSGKLCRVDMPPDLNKPVAAPRVESIAPRAIDRKVNSEHTTEACLLFWLHSERCRIFCPELHFALYIVLV